MSQHRAVFSSMVRAGKTTYFVDVKEAKNGKRYMQITETNLSADEKRSRSMIRVFPESVDMVKQAIQEASLAVHGS